jgi:hypothetical protein
MQAGTDEYNRAKALATKVHATKVQASSSKSDGDFCSVLLYAHKDDFVTYVQRVNGFSDPTKSACKKALLDTCLAHLVQESPCIKGHDALCGQMLTSPNSLDSWFASAMEKYKPGSVRTYKCVMKEFFNYLIAYQIHNFPQMEVCLRSRIAQLESFNAVIYKKCRERTYDRFEKDRHNLITLDDIRQLERSPYVLGYIRDILCLRKETFVRFVAKGADYSNDQWPPVTPPNLKAKSDAIDARDVLMTLFFFRSIQRTGAFIHMTLEDLEAALVEQTSRGPVHILTVGGHKTLSAHGPAMFVLEEELFAALNNYVTYLRPILTTSNSQDSPVFVTNRGPVSSGILVNALSKVGNAAGLGSGLRSITNMRKSIVTIMYMERPDDRALLAKQMTHRLSTGTLSLINFFFFLMHNLINLYMS